MQNLLIGVSGSGKSYEANVFHILAALRKGRKVITNLPVDIDAYADINPGFADLLEKRTKPMPIRGTWHPTDEAGAYRLWPDGKTLDPAPDARVFGGVWDYYDDWRHPETKQGPLYVIDECQYPLPKGQTDRQVEEWFALHRHFNADVLLLTQSYGKISQAIRDNVQMVYRVRKNVALGSTKTYTRKVQDGLRGEVVNTNQRAYDPKYFALYKSHTQGVAASESNASDIRPIWQHWSVYGAVVCLLVVIYMVASGKVHAPWEAKPPSHVKASASHATARPTRSHAAHASADAASSAVASVRPEPYASRGLHLVGYMNMHGRKVWSFVVSQNGQALGPLTDADLVAAGYRWEGQSHCSGLLHYEGTVRAVICDAPQAGVFPTQSARAQAAPSAPVVESHSLSTSSAVGLSPSYAPRDPVRDLGTTLSYAGSGEAVAASRDGEVLAWMRQR
jgi:zona occludens toxin